MTGADIFKSIPEAEMMKISEHVITRLYEDGEFVFMPGDDENHIFLVKEGEVEIYEASPEGKKIVIDRLVPGDMYEGALQTLLN